MRLPDFILSNTASILTEWDLFARSVWPVSSASPEEVRDHAEAILRAAAWDMKSSQTVLQQSEKSKGLRDALSEGGRLNTASSEHAVERAISGFDLRAVMAEYRALRASVVRLWFESVPEPDSHDLADLTRFHESMDQSLAEAVHRYSAHVDNSRQMFLRILGHDLRNPLNAIAMLAQLLAESRDSDPEGAEIAAQIISSTDAVSRMMNDFLDFAVSRTGSPMPVMPAPMDLAALCREVVAEVRASCPRCHWKMESVGEIPGEWDRARLRQLLSNLLSNAVQHGDQISEIVVSATTDGAQVSLSVHNEGPPIPEELLPHIFEPLVRGANCGARNGSTGLGLYIAQEVARAHGGGITVTSTASAGTTFTVTLPVRRGLMVPASMAVGAVEVGA
jgi:signal transduction histidine kinase